MYKRVTGSISVILALCLLQASMASAADPSLVGWWKLNEGAGSVANDSSGYGNSGTLDGGPTWAAGQILGGLAFDGSDDHVDCGNDPSLDITSAITIAAWVQPTGPGGSSYPRIVDKSNGTGGADPGYKLYLRSGENYLVTLSAGGTYLNSSSSLEVNAWNYLVFITDGTQRKLFLNGTWQRWDDGNLPASSTNPLYLGDGPAGSRPFEGILDEVRVYNRALAEEEIEVIMWNLDEATEHATDPSPAPGATDVPRDAVLSWTPGEFADTHDVYLGTAFEDVDQASRANPMDVLVSEGQAEASYDSPALLEFGQTYYWRVDEVNAAPDNTIFKGEVWSFTAEPFAYPVANVIATSNGLSEAGAGPENTVNGSGLNDNGEHSIESSDMWLTTPSGADPITIQFEFDRAYKMHVMLVWNYNVQFELMLGFGIKNATVEISENGADWTTVGDVAFAQATAQEDYTANTTVDLGGAVARYVRLTVNSSFGVMGQLGLSEVRFMYIPAHPREPQPADGATGVSPDSVLSWRAGRDAASHEIQLSTEEAAVVAGEALIDTVSAASYAPTDLEFGGTYYWKVDEVNEAEAIPVWEGEVWRFSTLEYVVIDDMESYDDDENAIFDTWLDGFVNGTGSTVGYFNAPFAEQSIVNSGGQSMPLEYVNDAAPFYSEAEYDLGGMDLETHGADTLRLFIAGQTPAFMETADGTIVMNGIGADIWGTADEFRYAYKTLSGDGSMVARVDSLADSDVWAKGGVMIRETVEPGSAFAAVYMTGDNGVRYQARLTADVDAVSDSSVATPEQIALREPVWVKIERVGSTFNGYYSIDGENWTGMAWNPQTIAMASDVTIGLALTSHNATVTTGAAFAGVAEEGGVSGNWQIAEIGVAQPTTTGNAIEPLYVALEDTSGSVAVVTAPNPVAVGITSWQEWLIPYSELSGINLGRVATMYIGVGDRDNPSAGGSGLIFIDDIGYGKPASVE